MKDKLILLLWCISLPLLILFILAAYKPNYEPDEGIWFCEELQIQLDYSGGNETFVIENGSKIYGVCGSDRGVKNIQVSCQQQNHPNYQLGELVFQADIRKRTKNILVVFEPLSKQEYIFLRIDSNV